MNQVAHIKFDETLTGEDLSHQITIHQKPNEPVEVLPDADGHGTIFGPDFSFRITGQQGGGFLSPAHFTIYVTGILKTPDGSCEASAVFDGSLIEETPPPPE